MFENGFGLRTMKSAIAVTIAIALAQLLGFEYPFFAGMTAIISMDRTILLSVKMARNRIAGTIIGAFIGACLATFLWRGSAVLCGVGVIFLCAICNKLKLQGAIGVGGIVLIAIMVHTDKTPLFYAYNRTATTILGGIVAVMVNTSICPLSNVRRLNQHLVDLWEETKELMNHFERATQEEIDKIHQGLAELETQFSVYKGESIFSKGKVIVSCSNQELEHLLPLFDEIQILRTVDNERFPEVYDYHKKRIEYGMVENTKIFMENAEKINFKK